MQLQYHHEIMQSHCAYSHRQGSIIGYVHRRGTAVDSLPAEPRNPEQDIVIVKKSESAVPVFYIIMEYSVSY